MRDSFKKNIKQSDLRLLERFQSDPTKSVKELAEAVGVPVLQVEMESGKIAFLTEAPALTESESGFVIYVNKHCPKEEMRWAVAHELGHFFLHRGNRGPFAKHFNLQNDYGSYALIEREEHEANNFAEDLFLSKRHVRDLALRRITDEAEVARAVGIPKFRAAHRLKFLGRVTEGGRY